jgi:hypothetical protein
MRPRGDADKNHMKIGCASLFGALWIAIWTAGTLAFDVILVRGVAQQIAARNWPSTEGRVITADIKVEHDNDNGSSYTPRIRYRYTVNDTEYQCDRIRYGFNTASKTHARSVVAAYPPGSRVVVHFDPDAPGRAVLENEILTGSDLFGIIFMIPFNVIMLGSWVVARRAICARSGDESRAAGNAATLVQDANGVRVRLAKLTPTAAAAAASAIAAFALVFLIAFTFGTENRAAAAIGCALVAAAGVFGYRRMRRRIDQGWYDLVIDDARKTVSLPPKLKRTEAAEISFDAVTGVDVEKIAGSGDDSDKYRPTMRWLNGHPQSAALVELTNRESAEQLAGWLRGRFQVSTARPS